MDVVQTSFGLFVVGGGEVGGLWEIKDKQKVRQKAQFEDALIAVVRAWPGQRETLVLGSGSDGRVFKYVNGTLTALYQSEAPEVVDVTFDKKGVSTLLLRQIAKKPPKALLNVTKNREA